MDIRAKEVALVVTSVNDYFKAIKDCMTYLVNDQDMGGVYVALTRPSKAMARRLEDDIRMDDLYFVDCVTSMSEGPQTDTGSTIYLESPTMLEAIVVKIGLLLNRVKTLDKFLFFDSINALSIYNDEKILSEFLHLLINNLRPREIVSMLLSVKGQTPRDIENMLKMMCDNVIEVR